MSKLMILAIFIIAMVTITVYVNAGSVELLQFCSNLNQSSVDANQCYDKPKSYSMGNNTDNFVLAYLCCVDYFTDVTYNYMPFMNASMVVYMASLKDETTLFDISNFLKMCHRVLNGNPPLTDTDYSYWTKNGRTSDKCISPIP